MMQLYVLPGGWADIDVATHLPMEPERGPVYAGPIASYLVVGSIVALVDTGIAIEHVDDPWFRTGGEEMTVRMRDEDGIIARLAQLGLYPDDVDMVVTTHFDCDHCGGHRYFPRARHVVQREQWEFAQDNPVRCPPEDWATSGIEYELLDGDTDLLPWLSVVATPGHVPGHQSVIVDLPESGPIILAGDAVLTTTMLERELPQGALDAAAALASIRRLKELRAEREARVIVGHDATAWRTEYRIAPDAYR